MEDGWIVTKEREMWDLKFRGTQPLDIFVGTEAMYLYAATLHNALVGKGEQDTKRDWAEFHRDAFIDWMNIKNTAKIISRKEGRLQDVERFQQISNEMETPARKIIKEAVKENQSKEEAVEKVAEKLKQYYGHIYDLEKRELKKTEAEAPTTSLEGLQPKEDAKPPKKKKKKHHHRHHHRH